MDNMDYDYCFKKGIHVIATSPVFSKPVAELALGMTLSLLRNIHAAHSDFIEGKEKYGLESNLKASLLSEKKIGLIGFGDLAKSLYPLLLPFTKDIIDSIMKASQSGIPQTMRTTCKQPKPFSLEEVKKIMN